MKTSIFIIVLVSSLIVGAGVAAIILTNNQVQTQVGQTTPCPLTSTDRDGDCIPDSQDYYPNDSDR